jgi:hypothetical protein
LGTLDLRGAETLMPRDAGHGGAPLPTGNYENLQPLTAHLIAARTAKTSATRVAGEVAAELRADADEVVRRPWRWVPIVLHEATSERSTAPLPQDRNLGNALVFRDDSAPRTLLWIEAPPLHLRSDESYDAGHFLLYHGGLLAGRAISDVGAIAAAAFDGGQYIGPRETPFDIDQYRVAALAHNRMVFVDPIKTPRWRGQAFRVGGGEQLFDRNARDYQTPPIAHRRRSAELLAYASQPEADYVALNLRPSYAAGLVDAYSREFFYLFDRILVVVDRYQLANVRVTPAAVFQLPTQPTANGNPLALPAQEEGFSANAGVWEYSPNTWLRWKSGGGQLHLRSVAPTERRLRIVGGPAELLAVPEGTLTGEPYYGGDPQGFERLIGLSDARRLLNAWYRLGSPPTFGPIRGLPHWGRVELLPTVTAEPTRLVTILAIQDETFTETPSVIPLRDPDGALRLILANGPFQATLKLPGGLDRGGEVELTAPTQLSWTVPSRVMPDLPFHAPVEPQPLPSEASSPAPTETGATPEEQD